MPSSEYDSLLDAQPAQQKSEYDALLEEPKPASGIGQIAVNAGQAALETIKGFIPTSAKQVAEFATPVVGAIEDIGKAGRSLRDIAFGKGIDETVKSNFPESQILAEAEKTPPFSKERFEAGFGVLGQFAMAAGLGRGLKPTLHELAFGKTESPLASETAAVEQIQKGGPSATEPNRQTGAIPAEQGQPTQQETAVQPQARDTRETPSEESAQEVAVVPLEQSQQRVSVPSGLSSPRISQLTQPEFLKWYKEQGMGKSHSEGALERGLTMTSDERYAEGLSPEAAAVSDFENLRRGYVQSAIKAGQSVPPEVLADFPHIKPSPVSEPTETTTVQPTITGPIPKGFEFVTNPETGKSEIRRTTEKGGESEKVQVKGEDEGKREKGVLTPEAATVQPPAAPSPQPKVGGVHAAALAERPIETPEPAEVITREEGIRLGNVWLDKGGDPQKIINHFNKTGEVGPTNMGRMTATLLRKQAATDFAKDALRENPTDPALQAKVESATADEQAFSNAYKPMHSVASASLSSLKGTQPLTEEMAQSYSGLERSYQEQTGKTFTPEQSQRAAKLSKTSQELNQQFKSDNEEVFKAADKAYKNVPSVRKVKTLDDLVAVLSQPMKEVC